MRLILIAALASATMGSMAYAAPQDSGPASAESVEAVATGVRLTAAVVAVPLRIAAQVPGAVLKQTFTGLSEGSREDPFAGTALRVDDGVLSNKQPRPAPMRAQPAPVVPREAARPAGAN